MILVLVETDGSGATEASLETVTFARDLATRESGDGGGGPVRAVVIGELPDGTVDQLGAHGVSEVHHATGEAFSAYGGAVWAAAVQAA
ncbi:MAG: electron transfer flavoprotein alpha subunit, partial [Pseudonocardiales bacterium]|nr:electron transfer flavoprotein alpha subunit [Pseudonocardiales bacterium]